MENSDYNSLLDKYTADQLDEAQNLKMEAILSIMKAEKESDLVFNAQDEQRLHDKIMDPLVSVEEIANYIPRKKTKMHSIWNSRPIKIAASIILLISLVALLVFTNKDNAHEIVAATNNEKIILPDGSLIWLKKSAVISYSAKDNRSVALSGEGLFEVAKDAQHPFTITCGEIKIKVLGTSFNLRSSKDNVEIHVLTGRVNISSKEDQQGVTIEPNQFALYNTKGLIEKTEVDPSMAVKITEHTAYNMQFSDTPLEEVFDRLADKFNVKFKVSNPEFLKCRITTDLTDRSLQASLALLKETFTFEYHQSASTVFIDGSGCK